MALERARTVFVAACLGLSLWPWSAALAQGPSPLDSDRFAFPGERPSPGSAASAGLALADRWLGEEPFANPAVPPRWRITVSPVLLRLSRQDLRAANRNYDETPAFFDGAGAAIGLPPLWSAGAWLYAYQPFLRHEDNAYTQGASSVDPNNPPAVIQNSSVQREVRAGLAVSLPAGDSRVGVAFEWTHRDDEYQTIESSGAPGSGTRRLDFSGHALGGQLGVRHAIGDSGVGHVALGGSLRWLGPLSVEGEQRLDLLTGDSLAAVTAERESGWEGGLSVDYTALEGFHVLAGLGLTSALRWTGFDLGSGSGLEWKLAARYEENGAPWSVRFGFGQELRTGVPEPRSGVFALGLGWRFEGTILDLGVIRRSFRQRSLPTSYDDRIVVSAAIDL